MGEGDPHLHRHGHGHDDHPEHISDYVRMFFTNWESYRGPLARKLMLTARNRALAFPLGCCGHPGEPGC
jgi:hypothetical protein